jgi:hypothetical protein
MPLFEIGDAHQLVGFRQLSGGADLYEREIEDLLWHNFEELTGETLFLVARQAVIAGGRPDIVALDHDARVVVIEIKRDVDRGQLAQCLEYAGWARTTNLDELAGMYHGGESDFFTTWQDFTGSDTPVRIRRSTRLILVAREFHGRTGSAFEFLIENGLPVKLIRVSIYQDQQGRRFVDVEGEHEPEFPAAGAGEGGTQVEDPTKIEGRRVRLTDLVDAGVLRPGQNLVWDRPQVGARYLATVTDEGALRLPDGRAFAAPSRAAIEAAGGGSYDGWLAWRTDDGQRESLHELRVRCVRALQRDEDQEQDGGEAGLEAIAARGEDAGPVEASDSRVSEPLPNSDGSGAT